MPRVHLNVRPSFTAVVTRRDCAFLSDSNCPVSIRKRNTLQVISCRAAFHIPGHPAVCRV